MRFFRRNRSRGQDEDAMATRNPIEGDDTPVSPAVVEHRWWIAGADEDDGEPLVVGGAAMSKGEVDALLSRVMTARPVAERKQTPWIGEQIVMHTENPTNFHQAMAVLALLSKNDVLGLAEKADLIDTLYDEVVTPAQISIERQFTVAQLRTKAEAAAEHYAAETFKQNAKDVKDGEQLKALRESRFGKGAVKALRESRFSKKEGRLIRDTNSLRLVSPLALQRSPWLAWLMSFILVSLRLLAIEALLAGVFAPSCSTNAECDRAGRPAFFCAPPDAASQRKRCHHCGDIVTDPLLLGPELGFETLLLANATAFCEIYADHQACLKCPEFAGWGSNATCTRSSKFCMPGWGDIDRSTVAGGNMDAMKTSDTLVLVLASGVVSFHIAAGEFTLAVNSFVSHELILS